MRYDTLSILMHAYINLFLLSNDIKVAYATDYISIYLIYHNLWSMSGSRCCQSGTVTYFGQFE